jgi:hypothetical protein
MSLACSISRTGLKLGDLYGHSQSQLQPCAGAWGHRPDRAHVQPQHQLGADRPQFDHPMMEPETTHPRWAWNRR